MARVSALRMFVEIGSAWGDADGCALWAEPAVPVQMGSHNLWRATLHACMAGLAALEWLRAEQIIAPGITTVERGEWIALRLAERRVTRQLLAPLAPEQRTVLDTLLQGDPA